MAKIKLKKNKNEVVLKKTFSNRRESVNWENSVTDSLDQWNKTKENKQVQIDKENFKIEAKKREEKAKIEKQKIFVAEIAKEKVNEKKSFDKRVEIDEKIRNKKRCEMKKRDVAFRNKSIYG